MANNSKEQQALKDKAIEEAFEELKEASTATVNFATYEKVVDAANEKYAGKLKTNISCTSLKRPSPKNEKFKEIKAKLEKFREEHKSIKNIAPKKSKQEIVGLREQRDNLVAEVTKYEHAHLEMSEEVEDLEATVEKLRNENSKLIKRLDELEAEK